MNEQYDFNSFTDYQINNSYWSRYNNMIKDMSNEQRIFVSKQDSVIEAKQNLMATFIDYLFERDKASFVNSSDDARKIADIYLETVKDASSRYVTRNEELEKENIELKKQIKQLMLDFGEKENGKDKSSAE